MAVKIPKPDEVGLLEDVADKLRELSDIMVDCGIDPKYIRASEVCRLYHTNIARSLYGIRAPGQIYAIPPRHLWPNIIAFCQHVFVGLRMEYGRPIFNKNFYRPPKYNKAVNGAARSRHIWAQGADLYPMKGEGAHELRNAAIDWFLKYPDAPIGIGLYPGNVHMDWGYARRVWGSRKAELRVERERRAEQADEDDFDKGGVPPEVA